MREADAEIWKYGDSSSHDLRHALAQKYGCPADCVIVGEGIDGLLGNLVRLTVATGDAVVTSEGAYPTFNYHVAGCGGTLHKVPYRDDHEDLAGLLRMAADCNAKLVYFANPDNPMGSWHSGASIAAALEDLPEGALLVLDEAYLEFAPAGTEVPLPLDDPRIIRLRTFSKAYGLAGARVGYALAHPDLIAAFDKVRNHFGMNRSAQIAALAALRDEEWLAKVQGKVKAARNRVGEIARENGLLPLPSATNFVAVDCRRDGEFARALLSALLEQGVFLRMPAPPPLDRCIRISCGLPAELDALAGALPKALRHVTR